jgi:hypothetical protein
MKSIVLSVLLLSTLCSFADENTNFIVATDWSEPIQLTDDHLHDVAIRGRLIIIEGFDGGPKTEKHVMTFVELQNLGGGRLELYFATTNLNCELTDVKGKLVPMPEGGKAWGGGGPAQPTWIVLPSVSTIRLFVNAGSKSPLTIYPSGEPWNHWEVSPSDTNAYYLSGTLKTFTPTNYAPSSFPEPLRQGYYEEHCKGTLTFPKVKISAKK